MSRGKQARYAGARDSIRYQEFWYTDRAVKNLLLPKTPVLLELGCGYGEHGIWFAEKNPSWNVVGIDRKGDRLFTALERSVQFENFSVARMDVRSLDVFLTGQEIDEIWITFPDPYRAEPERSVVGLDFLIMYQTLIRQGGVVRVKTDSQTVIETLLGSCKSLGLDTKIEPFAQQVVSRYQLEKCGQILPFMYVVEFDSARETQLTRLQN